MLKIAHISDIHIRGLERHDEHRRVLQEFIEKCKELSVNLIVITGDTWHTKTQGFTAEAFEILTWFLRSCSDLCDTHIILGNHDLNLSNLSRSDAISPIVNAIASDRLSLYKDSGIFKRDSYNLCVFSLVDKDKWELVRPIDGEINIAVFHGAVKGAPFDNGCPIDDEHADVDVTFFDGFTIAMLGDIHKQSFLTDDRRVAYAGSPCQHSFGEEIGKGFLVWSVQSPTEFDVQYVELKKSTKFYTIDVRNTVDYKESVITAEKSSRFKFIFDKDVSKDILNQISVDTKNLNSAVDISFEPFIEKTELTKKISYGILETLENKKDFVLFVMTLLRNFYSDETVSEQEFKEFEQFVKSFTEQNEDTVKFNVGDTWSLKTLKFDNINCYGVNNIIDFQKLNGVVGIFGLNESGKSSIASALLYSLFNSSDRGVVKNIDVINFDSQYCSSTVEFSMMNKDYRIDRITTRNKQKNDEQQTAKTQVNFLQIAEDGTVEKDLCEISRADTDLFIRRYIGLPEDFLMMNLSAQNMSFKAANRFITDGPSFRKQVLSRLLGFSIFEKLHKDAKSEFEINKNELSKYKFCDWDEEQKRLLGEKQKLEIELESHRKNVSYFKKLVSEHTLLIDRFESNSYSTDEQVTEAKNRVLSIEKDIKKIIADRDDVKKKIDSCHADFKKTSEKRSKIDIKVLAKALDEKKNTEKLIVELQKTFSHETHKNNEYKKSLETLADIPCRNMFPTCKFIRDANENQKKIPYQLELINKISEKLTDASFKLSSFVESTYDDELENYHKLLDLETEQKKILDELNGRLNELSMKISSIELQKSIAESVVEKLIERLVDKKQQIVYLDAKSNIKVDMIRLDGFEKRVIECSKAIGLIERDMSELVETRKNYVFFAARVKNFESLMNAFSKHGIPAMLIQSKMPEINAEIASVLMPISEYTFTLEFDKSGDIEIFINRKNGKRNMIESCCGLEKMIATIAIRTALVNMTILPKSDVFIIDEGFSSMDAIKAELCAKLLQSLTKFFKTIIVISHLDWVKDIVDDVIEITKTGDVSHVSV